MIELTQRERVLLALKRGPDDWLWHRFGIGKDRKENIIRCFHRLTQKERESPCFDHLSAPRRPLLAYFSIKGLLARVLWLLGVFYVLLPFLYWWIIR